jgi:hypothetical protein
MQPAIGYRAQRWQQQCDHAFPDGRPVVSGPITEVQALERDLETSQARGFWTPCSKDRTNRSINDSSPALSKLIGCRRGCHSEQPCGRLSS